MSGAAVGSLAGLAASDAIGGSDGRMLPSYLLWVRTEVCSRPTLDSLNEFRLRLNS